MLIRLSDDSKIDLMCGWECWLSPRVSPVIGSLKPELDKKMNG